MPAPDLRLDSHKETRASRVAAVLKAEILDGTLAPGAKINLDRLRERLDVSLAPVREAMMRLAAEGLVEVEEQRGYRIAPVSRANLEEVTRLRRALEVEALGLALQRADLDWEAAVLARLHRLERTPPLPAAPREAAHEAFHAALVSGAGMPMLSALCTRFLTLHNRYVRLLPDPAIAHAPAGEHARIAEAAVARDPAACTLLADHIERCGTAMARALASLLPETAP